MSKLHKIFSFIIATLNIIVAILTIASAFAGYIDPQSISLAPILCMTFPIWAILTIILIPITFLIRKRYTLIPLATLLICISPILSICPLNFTSDNSNPESNNSFSLLSYNVHNFKPHDNIYPEDKTNATLSFIIRTDADIVCMQECEYLSPLPAWHVYRPQVDSLKKQYPHRIISPDNGESILSKYPVKNISSNGFYSHFNVTIDNQALDIINVHLRSLRLTVDDKKQYQALADFDDSTNIETSAWKSIISKIAIAAKLRAKQATAIRNYIEKIDNKNIIVCGDFNDIPRCFAINTISDGEFKDVYAQCGFGPTITYHRDRIYFRIDHILYKGNFKATSIDRNDIDRSDHYPLYATFSWDLSN